jgi:hypothetical protein
MHRRFLLPVAGGWPIQPPDRPNTIVWDSRTEKTQFRRNRRFRPGRRPADRERDRTAPGVGARPSRHVALHPERSRHGVPVGAVEGPGAAQAVGDAPVALAFGGPIASDGQSAFPARRRLEKIPDQSASTLLPDHHVSARADPAGNAAAAALAGVDRRSCPTPLQVAYGQQVWPQVCPFTETAKSPGPDRLQSSKQACTLSDRRIGPVPIRSSSRAHPAAARATAAMKSRRIACCRTAFQPLQPGGGETEP